MPNLWSRDNTTSVIVDDQSPLLDYAYGGADWFNLDSTEAKGYNNNTLSATYVTGATMEITFLGSQAVLVGALPAGNKTYPSATYAIDGGSPGTSSPFTESSGTVVYYRSPGLSSGTHTLLVTVTNASLETPFFIDYFSFVPVSDTNSVVIVTQTSSVSTNATPSSSISSDVGSGKAPVGAIVGGVVGGITILVAFAVGAFFYMRRNRSQPYYFNKPEAEDLLGPESEPFYPSAPPTSSLQQSSTAPSSYSDPSSYGAPSSHGPRSYAAPSDYGAASAYGSAESEVYTNEESGVPLLGATSYSDHRSPPPSQESSNIGGQARTGKAAYIQQLHTQNPTEMVQHADSGIRFGDEGGPSSAPTEVPPSYSAT